MRRLARLFENNRRWAEGIRQARPDYFVNLAKRQQPDYFWIGCSDSRVTANEIVGLKPGELFVHRNVANLVRQDDPNCMAALEFAVVSLEIHHIIVCGHTRCGGVRAAEHGALSGPLGNWLKPLEDVCRHHLPFLPKGATPGAVTDALCEMNVLEQAANVALTPSVRRAVAGGHKLAIHPWLYDISTGLLREVNQVLECRADLEALMARLGREPWTPMA